MSDGHGFNLFILFTDGIGIQSVREKSYGTEFVVREVVGAVRDDVVSNCRFSLYCKFQF